MPKDAGGNENGGARGELDHKTKVEQDEMAAKGGVEIAKRCDRTEPKRHIGTIRVIMRSGGRSEIEGASRVDTDVREIVLQGGVVLVESPEGVPVFVIDLWEVKRNATCKYKSERAGNI